MGRDDTPAPERTAEADGRSVEIDTGAYRVQVWGDPDDSFEEVLRKAEAAADRAKADVGDLNDQLDGDDRQYS